MLGVEPRRFGDYVSEDYLSKKNEEAYSHVFIIHYPDEERPAARPLKTAPCYGRLKEMGAVFGQKFGWERANWFAADGMAQEDHWSFRRSRWFEGIRKEALHVNRAVGLLDMTPFAKCRISGPGAAAFLDYMIANRLPTKPGRIRLCHSLNRHGGVHSEFTITREADDSFYLVSAAAWQRLDHDYLGKFMPADGSVSYRHLTDSIGVFVVAGPLSRSLLQRLSDDDFSNEVFPFLAARQITMAGIPVHAMRVNYVGEMGWELHHPIDRQNALFDALFEAGQDLDLRPFGIRAMDSLRLEKSYRMVGTELSIEYSAWESGMDRFVYPDKGNFLGKEALLAGRERGLNYRLVTLEVHDTDDADALGNNALIRDGELIGAPPVAGLVSGSINPWRWAWSGRNTRQKARKWRSISLTGITGLSSYPKVRSTPATSDCLTSMTQTTNPVRATGGCLCGAVKYRVLGSLRPIVYAHYTRGEQGADMADVATWRRLR